MDDRAAQRALTALERYRDGPPKHPRRYSDLHEHVLALARAGCRGAVGDPINKDTELHPLVRWQYRGGIPEPERKAFLFTQPTDSKGRRFDISVLVAGLAANRDVYRLGFGKPLDEIGETWVKAIAEPIAPRLITHAPCQELVTTGADLERDGGGLDGLPVPISTPGWDNAPYLSAGHFITKDPDTGVQNVGNYRGQLKAPRRLGMNPSVELRAGIFAHWEKCKARGEPLPCAVVVGCPPVISYASVQKMPAHLDEIAVAGALAGGPINVVIALQCVRGMPESEIWRALYGAASLHRFAGKWIIAVDEDIEPENADALLWAMSYRCQPQHDLKVVPHKDPGHGPRGPRDAS